MLGFSKRFLWRCVNTELDPNGRFVIVHGFMECRELIIVAVYCTNVGQKEFSEDLKSWLVDYMGKEMIILEDFNAVVSKGMDRSKSSTSAVLPWSLCTWLKEVGLVDVWRMRNPYERDYTFFHIIFKSIQE